MKITGVRRVRQTLKGLRTKYGEKSPVVLVGYTANYALHVHENLESRHKEGQQAKYLEQPARELADDGTLGGLVRGTMAMGGTMAEGLLVAGNRLQRESQELVPVDTGNLKGSAFTRKE